jgi:hypothetical protein
MGCSQWYGKCSQIEGQTDSWQTTVTDGTGAFSANTVCGNDNTVPIYDYILGRVLVDKPD